MKLGKIIRFSEFQTLLALANENLTRDNWEQLLYSFDDWQLGEIGLDAGERSGERPKIDGQEATLTRTLKLREEVRAGLLEVVKLCACGAGPSDRSRSGKAWTWRKALVYPTGERFFQDSGEGFRFLLERLEYKVVRSALATAPGEASPLFGPAKWDDEDLRPRLHLAACACGCGEFFLWEGNWRRKQRRFLNDEHRMKYHNQRNTQTKRNPASRERANGNLKYFK